MGLEKLFNISKEDYDFEAFCVFCTIHFDRSECRIRMKNDVVPLGRKAEFKQRVRMLKENLEPDVFWQIVDYIKSQFKKVRGGLTGTFIQTGRKASSRVQPQWTLQTGTAANEIQMHKSQWAERFKELTKARTIISCNSMNIFIIKQTKSTLNMHVQQEEIHLGGVSPESTGQDSTMVNHQRPMKLCLAYPKQKNRPSKENRKLSPIRK